MEEEKVSIFNSGIQQLQRIGELWTDAHRHSRQGLLDSWNWDLDRVWCEVAADLNEDKERDNEKIKKSDDINLQISNLKSKLASGKMRLKDYSTEFYKLLMSKELMYRRLQNDLGKGTAYYEDEGL